MIIIQQHPDENTVNDLRYIADRVREVLYALEGSSNTAQSDAYVASFGQFLTFFEKHEFGKLSVIFRHLQKIH